MDDRNITTDKTTTAKPLESYPSGEQHQQPLTPPSPSPIDLPALDEKLPNNFPISSLWSSNGRSCIHEILKDPKTVPFKTCSWSKPFPSLTPNDLIRSKKLADRIAKAIQFIEQGGYGRVDLLTQEKCNTFHVHAMIPQDSVEQHKSSFKTEAGKKQLAIKLIEETPQEIALLYHTEEYTSRFPNYSGNRNIFDGTNGENIVPWTSTTCGALQAGEINHRDLFTFEFAIVPSGHALYSNGYPLPDGRRFLIWSHP